MKVALKKHDWLLVIIIVLLLAYILIPLFYRYEIDVTSTTPPPQNEYLNAASKRAEAWIEDINFLKYELTKMHDNLYLYSSEYEYFYKLDILANSIDSMSDLQVALKLREIIASLKHSHTLIQIDSVPNKYPIGLRKFGDDYYVVGVAEGHNEYDDLLFQRLVQINGADIKYISRELKKSVDVRNEYISDAFVAGNITYPELLKFVGVPVGDNDEAEFSFIDSGGNVFTKTIIPIDYTDTVSFQNGIPVDRIKELHKGENYWFHYYEDFDLLYINYNLCEEMSDYPFRTFTKHVFEAFDSNEVDKVFFDIRGNPGGQSIVIKPFIEEIKTRRLTKNETFFDEKGNFFVAINQGVYSSALSAFEDLMKNTNAIAIGTPTGHRLYGDPGGASFYKLPNSKLTLMYQAGPKIAYDKPPYEYAPEWDTAFYPNVYIYEDIESYMRGEDKLMEWVINYHGE